MSLWSIITMSGQSEVTRMSSGTVAGGFSLNFIPAMGGQHTEPYQGLSACTLILAGSTALLCFQVYLPCCRVSGQLERIWWMLGCLFPHNGHL